ncbi:cell division protein BolA [Arenimonas maotaiensis]|uniref:Cell division protein BolA n=1 Tax=Arenimonas maotaiensis TaxID=1446479 RepID=A0A917CBD0_9GAMM|nr:BolA family protein [Arenimonas maotaiensis]GGF83139.1 cell division protein BolA [Arenimonas maotaiensis]
MSADRVERIREALTALQPVRLDIRDDSAKHAGHAGARDGRGHFSVSIVSAAFDGLSPIQRHKRVYAAMGALMDTDVHALAIVAKTPAEAGA